MKKLILAAEIYKKIIREPVVLKVITRPEPVKQATHKSPWVLELSVLSDNFKEARSGESRPKNSKRNLICRVKPAHKNIALIDLVEDFYSMSDLPIRIRL